MNGLWFIIIVIALLVLNDIIIEWIRSRRKN